MNDRREAPRRKRQIKVLITDGQVQTGPARAWINDRSQGGLSLSLREAVGPGTVLKVQPIPAPVDQGWIPIKVKACRAVHSSWVLNCQFMRRPSYYTLLLFG